MGITDIAKPAISMFGGSFGKIIGDYWWILLFFVGIAIAIAVVVIWKSIKDKKKQWTHVLKIKRVLQNNLLSNETIINMRRFPLIKRAEVFELEKPLLGGYLMPELDSYSGGNEFSIIIDANNRIYTNKGEYFNPDKASINVSAKHSEIDIARANLRAEYQNINKVSKRVEWATIAKYAFLALLIIAVMIVSIVALGEWGDAQAAHAEQARSEAEAMNNLADAMITVQSTVNTQSLIIDKLNQLYGTKNINQIVKASINSS